MAAPLLDALAAHPFVFVVGKGGVGKTTTAAGVGLALADRGERVHLISTDPAHSLGDVFAQVLTGEPEPSVCASPLVLEEFDPRPAAQRLVHNWAPALTELIERGTYLESVEATGLLDQSMPGVDEVMGALRLVELAEAGGCRVVVDTAPIGHTLRLLDAGEHIAGWISALRAMADKAVVVASSLAGARIRLAGEALLDRLQAQIDTFGHRVLADAAFVVVYRNEHLVRRETARILEQLRSRGLRVEALVATGSPGEAFDDLPTWFAPVLDSPWSCDGLRRWSGSVTAAVSITSPPLRQIRSEPATTGAPAWIRDLPQRFLLFAGKGGVGKSTCAAATALTRADVRPTLLFSTDPAGSLADVLALETGARDVTVSPRLRARQIDARGELAVLRENYRDEVRAVFAQLGLDHALRMDREIIERLWSLAPPGMDELVALLEMLASLERAEAVVLDAAPTGHFLRLIAMPDLARDWTHALLRVFQQFRAVDLDETITRVIRFAKRLKQLRSELTDPSATGVILVTLDEPPVRAELHRLRTALDAARIPVVGLVVNRARPPMSRAALGSEAVELGRRGVPIVAAPVFDPPPTGGTALRRFLESWEFVP